jgi:electron transport complex protein RnfE
MSELKELAAAGLWRNNAAMVQLLGLCPLLAVTTTLVNGLALGLATAAVVTATNSLVSLIRHALVPIVRIPIFVLIIASLVTSVDLLTNAYFHDIHQVLGLFIPLIITNCGILAQAETFASRQPLAKSAFGGLATGLGFAAVLVTLGALREVLGHGTLLSGLAMIAGADASRFTVHLPFDGMLVAILPPGAFFGLAFLLAMRNALSNRTTAAPDAENAAVEALKP